MIKILIWEMRVERGVTLRNLEIRTGIPRSTLHRLECEWRSPTLAQLEKIAAALDTNVYDLFRVVK